MMNLLAPTSGRASVLGTDSGALGLDTQAPLRTLSRGTRMKAALLASLAYRPELVVLARNWS